nr:30S ribosomal protein S6e [Candidatus Njordarchaeum guaymaensis]
MPGVKLVVSDPAAKRAYQIEISEDKARSLFGRKIGETVTGDPIGLKGYELLITGGSDKDGFPMRSDMHGEGRKKILLASGSGYRPKEKGARKRKMVRGSTVTREIAQVNAKVTKKGEKTLEDIIGSGGVQKKQDEK